jgi:thiamine-monophosphate kinase
LNIIFPKKFVCDENLQNLANGFAEFGRKHGCNLIGGDTSVYNANCLIIAVTAIAEGVYESVPRRWSAELGDNIFLTKQVGTAFCDFQKTKTCVECGCVANLEENEYLMPSLVLIEDWSKINASMDISDGLIQDATKMAQASNVCLEIDFELLPSDLQLTKEMLKFGDDYNILLTSKNEMIQNTTKIGKVKEKLENPFVTLHNIPKEWNVEDLTKGFDHFSV